MADMLDTIFSRAGLGGAGGPRYLQFKRMIEEAVRSGALALAVSFYSFIETPARHRGVGPVSPPHPRSVRGTT